MKNILVPVGSNENAVSTLQYAIDFAKVVEAKVYVLNAFMIYSTTGTLISVEDILERKNHQMLDDIINEVDLSSVKIKKISAKGSVLESVKSVCKEINIDLIIVGPRPNSKNEEVFLGRTAGGIIKQTNIAVLIAPYGQKFKSMKTALMATKSGIVRKQKSLKPLKVMKKKFDLKIHALLVKTDTFTPDKGIYHKKLEDLSSEKYEIEAETTYEGVQIWREQNEVDLLVVFRRYRGFFSKLITNNTVLKQQFYCDKPMLVLAGKHKE